MSLMLFYGISSLLSQESNSTPFYVMHPRDVLSKYWPSLALRSLLKQREILCRNMKDFVCRKARLFSSVWHMVCKCLLGIWCQKACSFIMEGCPGRWHTKNKLEGKRLMVVVVVNLFFNPKAAVKTVFHLLVCVWDLLLFVLGNHKCQDAPLLPGARKLCAPAFLHT